MGRRRDFVEDNHNLSASEANGSKETGLGLEMQLHYIISSLAILVLVAMLCLSELHANRIGINSAVKVSRR